LRTPVEWASLAKIFRRLYSAAGKECRSNKRLIMLELELTGYLVIGLSAFLVGLAKTGVPGVGILAVPLMASALPARSSVGVLLGILILGDLFAAGYYRRHAQWRHVLRLLPIAFCGIVAGYFGLKVVNDDQLGVIIGVIVLAMLGINYLRTRSGAENVPVPTMVVCSWYRLAGGAPAGIVVLKLIPQKVFVAVVQILAAAAAVKLLF